MYIVATIHNNKLGSCKPALSWDDAVFVVREMSEKMLCRPLEECEIEDLNNNGEIYDESDSDNIWCISIGMVE